LADRQRRGRAEGREIGGKRHVDRPGGIAQRDQAQAGVGLGDLAHHAYHPHALALVGGCDRSDQAVSSRGGGARELHRVRRIDRQRGRAGAHPQRALQRDRIAGRRNPIGSQELLRLIAERTDHDLAGVVAHPERDRLGIGIVVGARDTTPSSCT